MMRVCVTAALVTLTVASAAHATEFTSPNGQTGAGLDTGDGQKGRIYGEGTAYYRSGERDFGPVELDITEWAFPLTLGGGYKIMSNLELEGRLGIAIARLGSDGEGFGTAVPANLHFGANYLWEDGPLMLKVGGALQFGPWTFGYDEDDEPHRLIAYSYSALTNLEDFSLYAPETLTIISPNRAEYRILPNLALTGDLSLALMILVDDDGDAAELMMNLAPGAAYLLNDWTLGGRIPLHWLMTDDVAQFGIEPYARYDWGSMFAAARFSLYLDNPYGFSFDEGEVWALHASIGGSF